MHFYVMTLFPELIDSVAHSSILGRAIEKEVISVEAVNIRDYSKEKHRHVDDYPYGGGAGMLMQAMPVVDCYRALEAKIGHPSRVIYLSPQGKTLDQALACELAKEEDLVLLCGHYEGIDERALEILNVEEVSIGDYVLTGGEMPSMIIIDAVSRQVPGVLSEGSAEEESFSDGLLEYPQYTRPEEYEGRRVPPVLLSGDHKKVSLWRREKSIERTVERRPDLLETAELSKKERAYAEKFMEELKEKTAAAKAAFTENADAPKSADIKDEDMMRTDSNGRISGLFLVDRVLGCGKVFPDPAALVFKDGHHELHGVSFSEDLKEDRGLVSHLKEITKDLICLFYEAEKEETLLSGNETGMTFLSGFFSGKLRAQIREEENTDFFTVSATVSMISEYPDAAKKLYALAEVICRFGRPEGRDYQISVVFSDQKPEAFTDDGIQEERMKTTNVGNATACDQKADHGNRTAGEEATQERTEETPAETTADKNDRTNFIETCAQNHHGFEMTYAEDELPAGGGLRSSDIQLNMGIKEDDAFVSFYGFLENEKEAAPALHPEVVSTLTELSNLMDDIGRKAEKAQNTWDGMEVSFNEGQIFPINGYQIPVPDGFRAGNGSDGVDAVLWRPNPEDPEGWEASPVLFYIFAKQGLPDVSVHLSGHQRTKREQEKRLREELVSRIRKY